jgi:hypothetical protein
MSLEIVSTLDRYRVAGEIFGRLITELGFGDLAMLNEPAGIMYQWSFNAKGKRYAGQYMMSFEELTVASLCKDRQHVEHFVKHMAEGWKMELRAIAKTDIVSVATNGLNNGANDEHA